MSPPNKKKCNEEKPGKRGRVRMKEITNLRGRGVYLDVQLSRLGVPMGESGTKMVSYACCRACETIDIRYESWRKVPKNDKEKIWLDVLTVFQVDHSVKKLLLQQAGKSWRNFKSRCKTKHIKNADGSYKENPPRDYQEVVTTQVWWDFIKYCETKEFKEKSQKAKENAAKNEYAHHLSRAGYKTLIPMLEEQAKIRAERDETEYVPPQRCDFWIKARVDDNGNPMNEATAQMIQRIQSIRREGTVPESGTLEDVLTLALGNPEHGGRVRAQGYGATKEKLYGRNPSSQHYTYQEFKNMQMHMVTIAQEHKYMKEILMKLSNERGVLLDPAFSTFGAPTPSSLHMPSSQHFPAVSTFQATASPHMPSSTHGPTIPKSGVPTSSTPHIPSSPQDIVHDPASSHILSSTQGPAIPTSSGPTSSTPHMPSSSSTPVPLPFPEVDKGHYPCDLMAEEDGPVIAHGTCFNDPNRLLHTTKMKDGLVRVGLDYIASEEFESTACPIDGHPKLHSMMGCFVGWPINLVILKDKDGKVISKLRVQSMKIAMSAKEELQMKVLGHLINRLDLPPKMRPYLDLAFHLHCTSSLVVPIPGDMFFRDGEEPTWIGPEDMLELLDHGMLQIQHMVTYIRFLHDIWIPKLEMAAPPYRFLCPWQLSEGIDENLNDLNNHLQKVDYVAEAIEKAPYMLLFVPFSWGNHWVLVIIHPSQRLAIWVDSIGQIHRGMPEKIINAAMKKYLRNKVQKQYNWLCLQCPSQEDSVSCGYFVMRYM